MKLRTLLDLLLEFIFPDRCAGCSGPGGLFCPRCQAILRPYPDDEPPPGLDGATVAWIYEGPLRPAIHRLKYARRRRVADPLGDVLAAALQRHPQPADALIPVPLHAERMQERGFNQSEQLARRLRHHGGPPILSGLERTRDTGHQAGLSKQERNRNIRGAFVWRGITPPPPRILLIDDVLTTGSTLVACADALRAAGAREVRAAAVARSLVTRRNT